MTTPLRRLVRATGSSQPRSCALQRPMLEGVVHASGVHPAVPASCLTDARLRSPPSAGSPRHIAACLRRPGRRAAAVFEYLTLLRYMSTQLNMPTRSGLPAIPHDSCFYFMLHCTTNMLFMGKPLPLLQPPSRHHAGRLAAACQAAAAGPRIDQLPVGIPNAPAGGQGRWGGGGRGSISGTRMRANRPCCRIHIYGKRPWTSCLPAYLAHMRAAKEGVPL